MEVAVKNVRLGRFDEPVYADGLCITLAVKNVSKKPVPFLSWSRRDIGVMLRVVKGITAYDQLPAPKQEARTINPSETIVDTVVFEPTPANKDLELDLPIPGTDECFGFRIPFALIDVSTPPAAPVLGAGETVQAEAATLPAPAPDGAGTAPEVQSNIRREYEEKAKVIRSVSMGMATNEGMRYRRSAGNQLLNHLSKKYGLDAQQIRRILNLD
jgi:hypothetical protein